MQSMRSNHHLNTVLYRALAGQALDRDRIRFLLSLSDKTSLERLFEAARQLRSRFFGSKIFMYGFLYFSTDCCNDCIFCKYRKSNTALQRYRKSPARIIEAARVMADAGVHMIDLTMGESPDIHHRGGSGFHQLVTLVRSVREAGDTPLMISPGVVPADTLQRLASAGVDWYACYQETYNRLLFAELRIGQSFDRRMAAKRQAREAGMLIEEGLLLGVGESAEDVADAILAMRDLQARQVRVMTFVPQPGTPMAHRQPPDQLRELAVIAVLRLAMPDRLIPASLDVGGLAGLQKRLNAGANVVTSLVVPGQGLSGVANQTLDIEQARRTPQAVMPVLKTCGLQPATAEEYRNWISKQRGGRFPSFRMGHPVAPWSREVA